MSSPYVPTTWITGDVVTAAKANNWETQYADVFDSGNKTVSASWTWANGVTIGWGDTYFVRVAANEVKLWNGSALGTLDVLTLAATTLTGTLSTAAQPNVTSVGTLTGGALGSGFTAVGVAQGGTGLATLTANRIPYGNGTSAFQSSASLTFDGTTFTAQSNTFTSSAAGLAGILTVSGFGLHAFTAGGTGENILRINNPTSGAANDGLLQVLGGSTATELYSFSQGYTTSTWQIQASTALRGNGAAGVSIVASNAAGSINFYAGGTTERARIFASGGVSIGNTTDPGAATLSVATITTASAELNLSSATGTVYFAGSVPKFSQGSTGLGIPTLGANKPTPGTADPIEWIQIVRPGNASAYVPCWQ